MPWFQLALIFLSLLRKRLKSAIRWTPAADIAGFTASKVMVSSWTLAGYLTRKKSAVRRLFAARRAGALTPLRLKILPGRCRMEVS